ncbi:glucans biosynthesis glucosyltransferase H [Devosia pacifica]|uniref:Glucans biosynthesis glucosyltransferase H n=2 Tax=Devosia pacifica TaxID=1335967 RepID=A0A918VTT7_9HYPH|nr:glucans biosynthesis glucosyltransferase H [Devosia pacifica]
MKTSSIARVCLVTLALGASGGGAYVFFASATAGGASWLDWARTALLAITLFWLVLGTSFGLVGSLLPAGRKPAAMAASPRGRTAILMPVYNEDPQASFARIAAMNRDLVRLGAESRFDFIILSDTTRDAVAAEEADWFARLLDEPGAAGRVYYRRRERNIGRKAGNIEDFVSRSGAAYDYALILDADSLMSGETIVEMAQRMDENSRLGLLQTVPRVIAARSFFGRCMQFSAGCFSPHFARGAALLQGDEGPYWGHNAIVRMSAFAACCGLPELSGPAPHGGHILSHDYVEAALLARGGWQVHVDPRLGGSFEEGPDNLIEYAKRDRRWCQGNLQHRRILGAPRLLWWSRFTLLQGIMAYLASPLWLALLLTSLLASVMPQRVFADSVMLEAEAGLMALAIAVFSILVLPKLLIVLRGLLDGRNKRFGGTGAVLISVLVEIAFSTVMAPVMLVLQTRAIAQTLLGTDGGWPATARDGSRVTLSEGFAASWWIVALGISAIGVTAVLTFDSLVWVLPVALPLLLAPFLIAFSSAPLAKRSWLLGTPESLDPPRVVRTYLEVFEAWSKTGVNHFAQGWQLKDAARVSA